MINNRWRDGRVSWVVPPLGSGLRGQLGASFQRATFSPLVGPEVFLLLLESEAIEGPLGWPTELRCKAGLVTTSHGPVAFLIWSLVLRGRRLAWYEQLLNPLHPGTRSLVSCVAEQECLKVAMVESKAGSVLGVVEHENVFVGPVLVAALGNAAANADPGASFDHAVVEFENDYSIEDLLE
jgi:hypothetical protein